jgi:4-hydroxy-tetrahydrodipicolinate synthase
MNNGKVEWGGVFPAIITPFTKSGEIDEAKFRELLDLLISEGIDGVVVAGCTGESWALKDEERLHLFGLAVDVANGRIPVIGGTSGIVTGDVMELSAATKETGAEGVLILPPYFARVGRREVIHHYKVISDGARVPIMLYNLPNRTNFNLTPDVVDELSDIEWVVAIKESHDDFPQFEATVAAVGDRIQVFTGNSANRGLAAVMMGAVGFVGAFEPQVMGAEGISLFELSVNGRLDEARRVQNRTLAMNSAVRAIGTAPANLKAALNLIGRPGGHVRPPLLDLDEAQTNQMRRVVEDLGLLTLSAAE